MSEGLGGSVQSKERSDTSRTRIKGVPILKTFKYLLILFKYIMGNANIEESLKQEIEELLKETKNKIRYQNLKGFIDNACLEEVNKIKKEKKK